MTDTKFGKILERMKEEELKIFLNKKMSKIEMIDEIVDISFDRGVKEFVLLLSIDQLKLIFQDIEMKLHSNIKKNEIRELFFSKIEEEGLEILLKKLNKTTLEEFIKVLKFQTDATNVNELADDINDEIYYNGARFILNNLSMNELKEILKNLNISNKSNDKNILIDKILSLEFPGVFTHEEEKEKKKKKLEKLSTNEKRKQLEKIRPKIEKGITRDELQQYYWSDEIKSYCKENGIKVDTKKEMIKKIIKLLDQS